MKRLSLAALLVLSGCDNQPSEPKIYGTPQGDFAVYSNGKIYRIDGNDLSIVSVPRKDFKENINVQVTEFDPKKSGCPADKPLAVLINNNSEKNLASVDFEIAVTELGHSTRYDSFTEDGTTRQIFSSDYIVKPSDEVNLCYSKPNLNFDAQGKGLVYHAIVQSALPLT